MEARVLASRHLEVVDYARGARLLGAPFEGFLELRSTFRLTVGNHRGGDSQPRWY